MLTMPKYAQNAEICKICKILLTLIVHSKFKLGKCQIILMSYEKYTTCNFHIFRSLLIPGVHSQSRT
jgi:hypothetical protein